MVRPIAAALLVAALALIHPGAAYPLPSDPPAGSPGGVVYELPFERGRLDAAPWGGSAGRGTTAGGGGNARGGGSAGGGAGAGGDETSLYRTENNFGSSAIVPGTAAAGVGAGQTGGPGSGGATAGSGVTGRPGTGAGRPGSGGRGAGGAGRAGEGVAGAGQDNLRGEPGEQTAGASVTTDIGLLGAIALLAALSGIAAGRAGRANLPG